MTFPVSSEDPFVGVQKEVQSAWEKLATEYSYWKSQAETRGRSGSHPSANAEVLSSRDRIKTQLHAIEWDLHDLGDALQVAQDEPARFGLSPTEISTRVRFVNEMNGKVKTVQDAIALSESVGVAGSNGAATTGRSELLGGRSTNTREEETRQANNQFVADEMRQQDMIMTQQDDDLDDLATAVERIGLMGHEMHQELAEQGEMLEDLGGELDHTRSRMATAQQKLDTFIAETGPRQFCTIIALCITFLILTVLVVST